MTKNVFTDRKINLIDVSTTKELKITTKVDAYSPSKEWYYGSISIENNSGKRIMFNFNQKLKIKDSILGADWNLYPVSFAKEAFIIELNQSKTWNVAWHCEKNKFDKKIKPEIIPDISILDIYF